jgi:hypothetical protein
LPQQYGREVSAAAALEIRKPGDLLGEYNKPVSLPQTPYMILPRVGPHLTVPEGQRAGVDDVVLFRIYSGAERDVAYTLETPSRAFTRHTEPAGDRR